MRVAGVRLFLRQLVLRRIPRSRARSRREESRLMSYRLEAENWRIKEANRIQTRFLANMAHDLRTPLNSIIGFADILNAGGLPRDSPKHQVFAGHISASGRQLLQLINDLLDLLNLEAGAFAFHPAPVRLPELVKEIVDAVQRVKANEGVAFFREVDASLTDLVLDASRLKQVLLSLVSSAARFTVTGGTVHIRGTREG